MKKKIVLGILYLTKTIPTWNIVAVKLTCVRWKQIFNHREYWTIYRGRGFLAVVWFGSTPTLSPPSPVNSWINVTHADWERETTCWRRGGRGRGDGYGAELYDNKRAWPFIDHSILSVLTSSIPWFRTTAISFNRVGRVVLCDASMRENTRTVWGEILQTFWAENAPVIFRNKSFVL